MASLVNFSDDEDDAPPMRLKPRPKGYRKTKKIHSLKKGRNARDNLILKAGNKLGHIQPAMTPGEREMRKLSKKLDKFVHRDEMESHLDSAFDVTKARRYVALRDQQQRDERKAWEEIKGNGTRVMCTWGEFVILQEELNDQEKMRNVAQLIVDCDKLEDEDPFITNLDGYDHYFRVTSGQHELWLGRASLMGTEGGIPVDRNGDTCSRLPFHRWLCSRHMASVYPLTEKERIARGGYELCDDHVKFVFNSKKNKKADGVLSSFVGDDIDLIRKKSDDNEEEEGDVYNRYEIVKGMLLTPLADKYDVQDTSSAILKYAKTKSKSSSGGENLNQAKINHDLEMERKKRETEEDPESVRRGGQPRRYVRWKAGREKKNKPCSCHFSGCIMIKWTRKKLDFCIFVLVFVNLFMDLFVILYQWLTFRLYFLTCSLYLAEERELLKSRCGQKGLPPGFNKLVYRQNRYLTDPIALVLYQLCELVREVHNAEDHVRKILGNATLGACMDSLEEVNNVRVYLRNAVNGPPPFKSQFDTAREKLKKIVKDALTKRMKMMK